MNYAAEGVLLALDQPLYLTSVHTFNFAVMTAYTLWLQVGAPRVTLPRMRQGAQIETAEWVAREVHPM